MEEQGGMGAGCYGAHGSCWSKSQTRTRTKKRSETRRTEDLNFSPWAKKSKKMIQTRDWAVHLFWCDAVMDDNKMWRRDQICCDITSLHNMECATCSVFETFQEIGVSQWCVLRKPTGGTLFNPSSMYTSARCKREAAGYLFLNLFWFYLTNHVFFRPLHWTYRVTLGSTSSKKEWFLSGIARITPPPPLTPFRATCISFFGRQNRRFARMTEKYQLS